MINGDFNNMIKYEYFSLKFYYRLRFLNECSITLNIYSFRIEGVINVFLFIFLF